MIDNIRMGTFSKHAALAGSGFTAGGLGFITGIAQ
jgi:hypothetical protein